MLINLVEIQLSCLSDVTMMIVNLKKKTKFAIKDVRIDRQCSLIDKKI